MLRHIRKVLRKKPLRKVSVKRPKAFANIAQQSNNTIPEIVIKGKIDGVKCKDTVEENLL